MRHLAIMMMWFLTLPALATSKDSPDYTEAINLGIAEFQADNFTEARAHFARAHAIYPNARTLRGLGMVAFELKRYADCTHYLVDALASSERPLEGEKRAQTEKLLERANGYLARYRLAIEPGTQLSVDGAASDLGPGGELVLEVGDHVLEFAAPGHIALKRPLTVQGGERDTLQVKLAALKSPASQGPADRAPGRPVYKNPWLWTAVGLVVAGAAAGTAIAIMRGSVTKTEDPYTGTGGSPALGTPR